MLISKKERNFNNVIRTCVEHVLKQYKHRQPFSYAFSGSWNSVVGISLLRELGYEFNPYFVDFELTKPDSTQFIKDNYKTTKIVNKSGYWDLLKNRLPPTPAYSWCCIELKNKFLLELPGNYLVTSTLNKPILDKRLPFVYLNGSNKVLIHMFATLQNYMLSTYSNGLMNLYTFKHESYYTKFPCILCPKYNKKMKIAYKAAYPDFYERWEDEVEKTWYNIKDKGLNYHKNFNDYLDDWYRYPNTQMTKTYTMEEVNGSFFSETTEN